VFAFTFAAAAGDPAAGGAADVLAGDADTLAGDAAVWGEPDALTGALVTWGEPAAGAVVAFAAAWVVGAAVAVPPVVLGLAAPPLHALSTSAPTSPTPDVSSARRDQRRVPWVICMAISSFQVRDCIELANALGRADGFADPWWPVGSGRCRVYHHMM